MNLLSPVSTIMTHNPITVSPEDSLTLVQEIFTNHRIHHIPVISGDKLVGIVSINDFSFFKRGFGGIDEDNNQLILIKLNNHKVSDIMINKLGKLEVDDRIEIAIDIFAKNIFHALPVLDNGRLVGIVTTHDIIKSIAIDNQVVKEY
jgi:CBS domain-containing protein